MWKIFGKMTNFQKLINVKQLKLVFTLRLNISSLQFLILIDKIYCKNFTMTQPEYENTSIFQCINLVLKNIMLALELANIASGFQVS